MADITLSPGTLKRIQERFVLDRAFLQSDVQPGAYAVIDPDTGKTLGNGFISQEAAMAFAAAHLTFEDYRNTTEPTLLFGSSGSLGMRWIFSEADAPRLHLTCSGTWFKVGYSLSLEQADVLKMAFLQRRTRIVPVDTGKQTIRIKRETSSEGFELQTQTDQGGRICIAFTPDRELRMRRVVTSGLCRARALRSVSSEHSVPA